MTLPADKSQMFNRPAFAGVELYYVRGRHRASHENPGQP